MSVLPTVWELWTAHGERRGWTETKLAFIANPLINLLITVTHVGLKGLVCARQAPVTLVPFIPFSARAGTQHDLTMGPGTAMHR